MSTCLFSRGIGFGCVPGGRFRRAAEFGKHFDCADLGFCQQIGGSADVGLESAKSRLR